MLFNVNVNPDLKLSVIFPWTTIDPQLAILLRFEEQTIN